MITPRYGAAKTVNITAALAFVDIAHLFGTLIRQYVNCGVLPYEGCDCSRGQAAKGKRMNYLLNRSSLIGLGLLGAAASQAYGFVDLRVPNTGEQQNIVQQGVFSASATGSFMTANSNTSTNISLMGSNFVTTNIEVLAGVNYASYNSNNTYGFTVGGRYYFAPAQDKNILPFAGVTFSYGSGNNSVKSNAFGVEAGVQYFLAPNVSFTPLLVWSSTHVTGSTTDSFGLQFGLTYWFK